jgi:hypothetical protein
VGGPRASAGNCQNQARRGPSTDLDLRPSPARSLWGLAPSREQNGVSGWSRHRPVNAASDAIEELQIWIALKRTGILLSPTPHSLSTLNGCRNCYPARKL